MTLKDLLQFFYERPSLNPGKVFEEAGLYRQKWYDLRNGKHDLTEDTINKLKPVMIKYGWKSG